MFNNLVREHCHFCKFFLKSLIINIYVVAIKDKHSWGFCWHKYELFKQITPQKHRFQWWAFILQMFYLGISQPFTIFCQLQWSRVSALRFWHSKKWVTLKFTGNHKTVLSALKHYCCINNWRYPTILGCCFGLTPPQLNKIFIPSNSCCFISLNEGHVLLNIFSKILKVKVSKHINLFRTTVAIKYWTKPMFLAKGQEI